MSKQSDNYWAKAQTTTGRDMSRLMHLLESGVENPVISEDACKIIQVLMETDPKTVSKLKSKMSHKERAFMNVPSNKQIAEDLSNLRNEFSIRNITNFLKYDDTIPKKKKGYKVKKTSEELFSVSSFAKQILDEWKGKSLKKLSYQEVKDQFMSWVFLEMRATDLQVGILNLMKTPGPISKLVIAPTGGGKTFGFGAVMGVCTDSLLCFSPTNRTSMQDFIGATTNAGVPVCIANREPLGPGMKESERKIIYTAIYETMGKASKMHGLQVMVDTLKKNKQMRRTRYKTHMPRIVVCEPSLRNNGLCEVYEEISTFCANLKGQRTLYPTVVVDDFCASVEETTFSTDAHRLITTVDRVILLTATPPTNMDLINKVREGNDLSHITQDAYPKTLGMGVSLFDENGEQYSLLDDLQIFDHSPFALSTLTPSTVFTLLKEIYGELEARNLILSKLPSINLDDLRDEIVQHLKDMPKDAVSKILDRIPKENLSQQEVAGQTLILDRDPSNRLKEDVGDITLTCKETGRPWIDTMKKNLDRYFARVKNQQVIDEKIARSKISREDKDAGVTHRGTPDTPIDPFYFEDLASNFIRNPAELKNLVSLYESNGVSDMELCYILQKQVLLVTKTTDRSWVGNVLPNVNTIYGDESMSAGVHISRLCKVHLPRQLVDPFTAIQGMGRVGRPHQGAGIVVGSKKQFAEMFSRNVGDQSLTTLNESISRIYNLGLDIEEEAVIEAKEEAINEAKEEAILKDDVDSSSISPNEKKKSKRSVEARRRRNKKKKKKRKVKRNDCSDYRL